jgi:hypothetical protein
MATVTLPTLDISTLVGYYNAKLPVQSAQPSRTAAAAAVNSATAHDAPPWEANQPTQQARDAAVLSTDNFLDLSTIPRSAGGTTDSKTEQDNQKLFALYRAVNTLYSLSEMAKRDGMTAGQLQGFNTRFQQGLTQVRSFVGSASFNNFALQAGQTSASVTSKVAIPFAPMTYTGGTIVNDADLANALPELSTADSFDIAIKENGVTTDVPIALADVQGPLSLDNVVAYANQQLSAAGFGTRFARAMTAGSIDDLSKAKYGITLTPAPGESVTLSSASATPALYVAGTSGTATGTKDNPTPDQQGRLVKLTGLDGAPQGVFNAAADPDSGTTAAQSTVVDADGNVYVLGTATGDFGNELNQGTQDAYLSKYDSAGNLQWTKLVGSAGAASGTSMALDASGGIVVAGTTTAKLTANALADGSNDSFVARYDANGNQSWVKQIQTLNANQGLAVSTDASGNVYLGGQVTGVIGAGQTSAGGSDAYLAKFDSKGTLLAERQFGTGGADQISATATTSSGDLIVASVQSGHAIVSKYAAGDITSAPAWQIDLGDLQNGGAIGGLAVSGDQVYLSGSTSNAALDADGQATIANASAGGSDAFVANLTDNGAGVAANRVSYVGTGAGDKGSSLTVGSDGTVYLAGTTTGTFAGQSRTSANTDNLFVSALASDGSLAWTRQYGGADGQSAGRAVALDPQGGSVLDALGLPRGSIAVNQSVDLISQTTLRAGDSFSIQIQSPVAHTSKIAIEAGETLKSLAAKINAALLSNGKATVNYAKGGKGLQIKLSPGVTGALVAGPADFDALARLGIAAGTLSNPSPNAKTQAAAADSGSNKKVFGLGLNGSLDVSAAKSAGAARAQLLNVLSAIRNAYRTTNAPPSIASNAAQTSGPAPAYLASQLANYSAALNMLSLSSQSGNNGTA